jgi:hypothetical protein
VRVGVEPFPRFSLTKLPANADIFAGSSDDYFSQCDEQFDIIFVDGLHEANQAYRDVVNSFRVLNAGGVVLLDDVFPLDEPSSLPSLEESGLRKQQKGIEHHFWYGDVYKCLGVIQENHPELKVVLVGGDPHHIQGLIWKPNPEKKVTLSRHARALMSDWEFGDFFPRSNYIDALEILPEREAILSVPISQP